MAFPALAWAHLTELRRPVRRLQKLKLKERLGWYEHAACLSVASPARSII